jgi:glycine/D-amino acid oxidase-like deaminating enzyme
MSATDYDVVVIGAGALGSCTARELAPDHDVCLIEKGQVARSAGGHAAGIISDWWFFIGEHPIHEATEIMHDFFEDFDGTGSFEFNPRPFIRYLHSPEEREVWQERTDELDVDYIKYYSNEDIEERWPDTLNLEDKYGAIVDERAGFIDPHTYVTTLADDAEDRGADVRTQTPVTDILDNGDEVTGVEVNGDETITADKVVVTAGTFTRELVSDYVDIPTKSFIYTNVRIRVDRELPDDFPIAGPGLFWWRPEAGGNLFISGGEYWLDGMEDRDISRTDPPIDAPEEYKLEIAEQLPESIQWLEPDDIRYMSGSQHHCPDGVSITSDGYPVIDELNSPEGLIIADGMYGGVSLAPSYATALKSLVEGDDCPWSLEPFAADRFDDTSLDFDYDWIKDWPMESAPATR